VREFVQLVFWLSCIFLLYVYLGYPALLLLLSRLRRAPSREFGGSTPRVALIVSAYNEQGVIEAKIKNCLALDYPSGLLTIVIASDGSDDGTDEIALRYASMGIQLVRSPQRAGKSAVLNLACRHASGEIFIFSDANAMYSPDAVRQLVRHFADPGVGYVVGNARYVEDPSKAAAADSEGLYWKLETWLKKKESDFGSVVGGDGAIYAIRRELYTPLRSTDINDFLNPLQIIVRGYRGVYAPEAVCFEEAGDTFEKEFNRKVRIVSRSLNAVRRAPRVLLPWTQPRHCFALYSHKILRWFAPCFLLFALAANLLLWPILFYRVLALAQLGLYLLAALGWAANRKGRAPRVLYVPYYFVLVNLAAALGVLKCLTGSLSATWSTVRQEESASPKESIQLVNRRP